MIHELDAIENDTDKMQISLRHNLYDIEKDMPPIDTIFLYKIIDWVGELADKAQDVGGHLLILVAR